MSIVGGQGTETQEKRKEQRVKGRDPRKNIGISATLHPEKTGFPLRYDRQGSGIKLQGLRPLFS